MRRDENPVMAITKFALQNRLTTLSIYIAILIGGAVAAFQLPIQLVPKIDLPQVRVIAGRPGASAKEIESIIIEPIEKVLMDVPGVEELVTEINAGQGELIMTFSVDSNMDIALLHIVNAMNRIPPLPRDVSRPVIISSDSPIGGQNAVATIHVRPINPLNDNELSHYQPFVRDNVQLAIEGLEQVSYVHWQNFRSKELHITFDPRKAAMRGISLHQLRDHIQSAVDKSGGFNEIDNTRYTVLVEGQLDIDKFTQLIIGSHGGIPIRLSDVAVVEVSLAENRFFTMRNGMPSFYMSINAKPNVNTVNALDAINTELHRLNKEVLQPLGLIAELSFDASLHIRNALNLVKSNLGIGVLLALFVLYYFLRGWKATLTIALSVPTALSLCMIALFFLERSLNVISMAGMVFSIGLVMDAAIIVQETILRHSCERHEKFENIANAGKKVGGAILSSTLTTVVIFIPILFMKGVAGQLFSDLAITIAVAVIASFIIAMTLIPLISYLLKNVNQKQDPHIGLWGTLTRGVSPLFSTPKRAVILLFTLILNSTWFAYSMFPPLDFMPKAPTDGVFYTFTLSPSSTQHFQQQALPQQLKSLLAPYMHGDGDPRVKDYNFFVTPTGFAGGFVYAENLSEVPALMKELKNNVLSQLPVDHFDMVRGSMINISGANTPPTVHLNVQGKDLAMLRALTQKAKQTFQEAYPTITVRMLPVLGESEPTLKVTPNDRVLAATSMTREQLGDIVDSYTDGMFAGEYFDGNERINMILQTPEWHTVEQFESMLVTTPDGNSHALSNLANIVETYETASLRRVNGWRTVTLSFMPQGEMPLGDILEKVKRFVVPVIKKEMPSDARISITGNADKMSKSIESISINFLAALFVLFMLMAAHFKSLVDSAVVMSVIPLATLGGLVALEIMNFFDHQPLDLLTVIGFVILLGLVVNNAILLISEVRYQQGLGKTGEDPITKALSERLRTITLSTLTSILGMLPLAIIPGPGAEIYRGLASVIVGGMVLCSVGTLILIPAWMRVLPYRKNTSGESS